MKTTFLLSVGLGLTSPLFAQFYASETEFHDISQRTYPVQAARRRRRRRSTSRNTKTADEFWAAVEKLKEPPAERPRSQADVKRIYGKWLENERTANESFIRARPQDARRWDAKVALVTTRAQLARMDGKAAPDASANANGEAAYVQLMQKTQEVDPKSPHTFMPFHRAVDEYLTNYGGHARGEGLRAAVE